MPVGGIKEKVLAAHRAGIKTVILPERNQGDLQDVSKDVRKKLKCLFAKEISEVLARTGFELSPSKVPLLAPLRSSENRPMSTN